MRRVLLIVTFGLVGLGCGGAGTSPPAAPAPATAPAPRLIESREMPPSGAPPDGWMAGSEIGAPASEAVAPVRIGAGSLPKEQIREVMKANQPKVRSCYERELLKNPRLAGTVVVKFVIRADGSVASAVVKSSTLGNAAVEQCIADAVTKLVFPRPLGGGIVVVSYPYTLQTSE